MRAVQFIVMLSLVLGATPAVAETSCCTLSQILSLWDEGHPVARISEAELQAAEQDVRAAWGAWIPQASFRGRATTSPGAEGDGFTGFILPHVRGLQGEARTDFVAPLFASGQLWVLQELAALGVDVAEATLQSSRQTFRWRARTAFQDVQAHHAKANALEGATRRIAELRKARSDLQEGSPDGLALEVLAGDLRARRILQDDELLAARIALGGLIGEEGDLPDALGPAEALDLPSGSLEEALERAFRARPDWRSGKKALEAANMNATLQSLRWLPELGLVGRWSIRRTNSVTDQTGTYQRDVWNGGSGGLALGIQWDINPARRLKESGRAEWTSVGGAALLEALRGQITWEVRSALAEESRARRRVAAEETSTEAAFGWLTAQMNESRKPGASIREFTKALRQHLHRQQRQHAARHSLGIARARLIRVLGGSFPVTGRE